MPVVRSTAKHDEIGWDPVAGRLDPRELAGVDAVVNLAGAGIGDHRWTDDYKREVLESRTKGTALLAQTLADADDGPPVLLSGSAIGFYGDRGDEELDEQSAPGTGFLGEVARQWEASTAPAAAAGVRVAHLRTGIVLAPKGGVLAKFLPLFKFGVGGRFGPGTPVDELDQPRRRGVGDRPPPDQRRERRREPDGARRRYQRRADRHARRRAPPPDDPARAGVRPACCSGGERADGLLFEGQRVLPRVLQGDGFVLAHPTLADCLHAILGR